MWSTVIRLFSVVTNVSVEFENPLVEVERLCEKSHIILEEFIDFPQFNIENFENWQHVIELDLGSLGY
jgi:hypothetical protein